VPALVVAVLLSGCSVLGGGGGDTYTLTAYFPRAVSLFPSSDVRVLGLPAGKVKSVDAEGTRVKVVMEISSDTPVPSDVNVGIIPLSLIGERYVQLSPAWKEGEEKAKDGDVIPIERAIVPVEPDEALAALKEFLDTLDPDGVGRLIENADKTLKGNGTRVNDALDSAGELLTNFAEKDDTIIALLENFDEFTATLRTREAQLGEVMDAFAAASGVLADERRNIEQLVKGLGSLSTSTLDLVSEHSSRLAKDIEVLTRITQDIQTNIGSVEQLLDSGPLLVKGLTDAYNPELHAIDLRNSFSPAATEALGTIFEGLGLDPLIVCIPVDVACPAGTSGAAGRAAGASTPIGDMLGLLGSPGAEPEPAPSNAERVGRAAGSTGDFLRQAGNALLGVS
jgi:virulence factor Mce-like protein